jgi:hypothetical protein
LGQDVQDANDFMAQLGGIRKILTDNNLKEKPPAPSTKQRNAHKANAQEQNSRDQKSTKFAGAPVKGKAKQPEFASSYLPTRQETVSDSESKEDQSAALESVMKIPKRIDYLAMNLNAHCCNVVQDGN